MSDNPVFSLIHAVARFPGWHDIFRSWCENWRGTPAEYIACCELKDWRDLQMSHSLLSLYPNGIPLTGTYQDTHTRSGIANYNRAASISCGRVLVTLADDYYPPPGWDKLLLEKIEQYPADAELVLHVSTCMPRDPELMTHPIMTRPVYERWGYMFYPGYRTLWADNDNMEHARQDGILIDCLDLKFEHRHYLAGKAPYDEIYAIENGPGEFEHGLSVFSKRAASQFKE